MLTPAVFDGSRLDLGDLRLYDGRDHEVPFALRVRSTQNEQQPLKAKEFNRQRNADRSVQVNLDLGPHPAEHQQVEVVTRGVNFRRRVQLRGSDNAENWGSLDEGWIAYYEVDSQKVDVHRLRYATSRFRYLQVQVYPDLSRDDDKPELDSVTVYHTAAVPGEYPTCPADLGQREAVRAYDAPGSAWIIDLGADRVPVEKLAFEANDSDFCALQPGETGRRGGPRALDPGPMAAAARRAGQAAGNPVAA